MMFLSQHVMFNNLQQDQADHRNLELQSLPAKKQWLLMKLYD